MGETHIRPNSRADHIVTDPALLGANAAHGAAQTAVHEVRAGRMTPEEGRGRLGQLEDGIRSLGARGVQDPRMEATAAQLEEAVAERERDHVVENAQPRVAAPSARFGGRRLANLARNAVRSAPQDAGLDRTGVDFARRIFQGPPEVVLRRLANTSEGELRSAMLEGGMTEAQADQGIESLEQRTVLRFHDKFVSQLRRRTESHGRELRRAASGEGAGFERFMTTLTGTEGQNLLRGMRNSGAATEAAELSRLIDQTQTDPSSRTSAQRAMRPVLANALTAVASHVEGVVEDLRDSRFNNPNNALLYRSAPSAIARIAREVGGDPHIAEGRTESTSLFDTALADHIHETSEQLESAESQGGYLMAGAGIVATAVGGGALGLMLSLGIGVGRESMVIDSAFGEAGRRGAFASSGDASVAHAEQGAAEADVALGAGGLALGAEAIIGVAHGAELFSGVAHSAEALNAVDGVVGEVAKVMVKEVPLGPTMVEGLIPIGHHAGVHVAEGEH